MGRRKYTDTELAAITADVAAKAGAYWLAADEETREAGRGWYPVAHAEAQLLAAESKLTVSQAAGIIAVLSPLTRWTGNLDDAWAVATGGDVRHALPVNVAKAKRILAGENVVDVLGGKKVTAFWYNILHPLRSGVTTNDSWIARGFGIDEREIFGTYGVYEAVTAGFVSAGRRYNEIPSALQATAWIQIKRAWQRYQDWQESLPVPL